MEEARLTGHYNPSWAGGRYYQTVLFVMSMLEVGAVAGLISYSKIPNAPSMPVMSPAALPCNTD